jgi:hypothetical protein
MNEEQKKDLFGEEFWNHTEDFEFSKGDKVVIAQMREVSKQILEKETKDKERVRATYKQPTGWRRECKQGQIPIIDVSILSKPNTITFV